MFGVFNGREAVLFVEPVRVVGDQNPAAHFLQVRMFQDGLDEPFAETVCTVIFVDEHIAQISKDRVIADNTRDPYLFLSNVDAKDKRILDGAFGAFTRACVCPIGASEKITNGIDVKPGRVGADGELIAMGFNYLWHGESVS